MQRNSQQAAFTLIELMVVIGIIGVLVGILVPVVGRAVLSVRSTMTRSMIRDIGLGLEAFKKDFGDYPPSDPGDIPSQYNYRAGCTSLVHYLRGPQGSGWGVGGGGEMPFETGSSSTRSAPSRTYGPYFDTGRDHLLYTSPLSNQASNRPVAFLDYFEPPGIILYFKAARTRDGDTLYDWSDCNKDGSARISGRNPTRLNYLATHFDQFTTGGEPGEYYRNDYMLISPGPDSHFGYMVRNQDGSLTPARGTEGYCDDFANWN